MPKPMTRAEMIESFWPYSHRFLNDSELDKLRQKGIVYHQCIVPLTEDEKKQMSEVMPQENKVDTEEKQDLS
jgi:hypothetical protein